MIPLTGRLVTPQLVSRPRYNVTFIITPRSKHKPYNNTKQWNEFGDKVWWAQCGRKKAFFTFEIAKQVHQEVKHKHYKKNHILVAYECPFCDWYHLGHQKISNEIN